MRSTLTPKQLSYHLEQAMASTALEGHVPTAEFLADNADFVAGRATTQELIDRSIARAVGRMPQANEVRVRGGRRL